VTSATRPAPIGGSARSAPIDGARGGTSTRRSSRPACRIPLRQTVVGREDQQRLEAGRRHCRTLAPSRGNGPGALDTSCSLQGWSEDLVEWPKGRARDARATRGNKMVRRPGSASGGRGRGAAGGDDLIVGVFLHRAPPGPGTTAADAARRLAGNLLGASWRQGSGPPHGWDMGAFGDPPEMEQCGTT